MIWGTPAELSSSETNPLQTLISFLPGMFLPDSVTFFLIFSFLIQMLSYIMFEVLGVTLQLKFPSAKFRLCSVPTWALWRAEPTWGHRMLRLWTSCAVPVLGGFQDQSLGPFPARRFGLTTSWGPCQPKISYGAIIKYHDGLKKKRKSYEMSDIIAKGK